MIDTMTFRWKKKRYTKRGKPVCSFERYDARFEIARIVQEVNIRLECLLARKRIASLPLTYAFNWHYAAAAAMKRSMPIVRDGVVR